MSGADPEAMTRAELETEVSDLREDVQNFDLRMDALKTRMDSVLGIVLGEREPTEDTVADSPPLFDRIDDLDSAVSSHGETLASIADVGNESTSKDEKIGSIVAYAEQACPPGQDKVIVTAKEIRGQTGVSRRYAYDLIDDIGGLNESGDGGSFEDGRFEWAAVRTATDVPTPNGRERKPKALKIDFERVHTEEGSVNKFTTRSGGQQGR